MPLTVTGGGPAPLRYKVDNAPQNEWGPLGRAASRGCPNLTPIGHMCGSLDLLRKKAQYALIKLDERPPSSDFSLGVKQKRRSPKGQRRQPPAKGVQASLGSKGYVYSSWQDSEDFSYAYEGHYDEGTLSEKNLKYQMWDSQQSSKIPYTARGSSQISPISNEHASSTRRRSSGLSVLLQAEQGAGAELGADQTSPKPRRSQGKTSGNAETSGAQAKASGDREESGPITEKRRSSARNSTRRSQLVEDSSSLKKGQRRSTRQSQVVEEIVQKGGKRFEKTAEEEQEAEEQEQSGSDEEGHKKGDAEDSSKSKTQEKVEDVDSQRGDENETTQKSRKSNRLSKRASVTLGEREVEDGIVQVRSSTRESNLKDVVAQKLQRVRASLTSIEIDANRSQETAGHRASISKNGDVVVGDGKLDIDLGGNPIEELNRRLSVIPSI